MNAGETLAAIPITSLVCGLRPERAALLRCCSKVPKPASAAPDDSLVPNCAGAAPTEPSIKPWASWWRDAEAAPELAPLLALRSGVSMALAEGAGDNGLTTAEHRTLLRDAGYSHVDLPWQRGRSGILAARHAPG